MQNMKTEKIIVDKVKLQTLIRLGCNESAIVNKILYNKFESQQDDLIDLLLTSLTDEKEFHNWGGSRSNSGRKSSLNQDEKNQDEIKMKKIKINQVVDKDKDKDKDKDNKYGELKNVRLTEEQYAQLSERYSNIDKAIEKLDTWLGTSGSKNKNKNHFAYFKSNSWVWENISQDKIHEDVVEDVVVKEREKEYDIAERTRELLRQQMIKKFGG